MRRYFDAALAALVIACTAASGAPAERALFTITDQGYVSITSLRLAVSDDQSTITWQAPESWDPTLGPLTLTAINDDHIQETTSGTAGGKMQTNPLDPAWPYYTPGPHYSAPLAPGGYYGFGAGVGPEFVGNWVGLRFTAERAIHGVRFNLSSSYKPDELRTELWTLGLGIEPALVSRFDPQGFTPHEIVFEGGDAAEFRFIVGPVPEPSGLLVIIAGLASLGPALIRKTAR